MRIVTIIIVRYLFECTKSFLINFVDYVHYEIY